MSRTHYIRVAAEVNIADFEEDDLVDYLRDRGYLVSKQSEEPLAAIEVYNAMKVHAANERELIERFILESANKVAL